MSGQNILKKIIKDDLHNLKSDVIQNPDEQIDIEIPPCFAAILATLASALDWSIRSKLNKTGSKPFSRLLYGLVYCF